MSSCMLEIMSKHSQTKNNKTITNHTTVYEIPIRMLYDSTTTFNILASALLTQ